VSLVTDGGQATVPDVRGLSARDAVRKLVKVGLVAQASGDGFVVAQQPESGTPFEPGSVCRLTLARLRAGSGGGSGRP
jgi:beta-lactam-binding protein with PASTA domain